MEESCWDLEDEGQTKEFLRYAGAAVRNVTRIKEDQEDVVSTIYSKCLEAQRKYGKIKGIFLKIIKNEKSNFLRGRNKKCSDEEVVSERTIERLFEENPTDPDLEQLAENLERIALEDKSYQGEPLERYIGDDLENILLVYNLARKGKLKHIPYHFFEKNRDEKIRTILKYLQENIWKCTPEEMWNRKREEYANEKLEEVMKATGGMIPLLEIAFPHEKPKKRSYTHRWTEEEAIESVRTMVRDLQEKGAIRKPGEITKEHFQHYGLYGVYQTIFGNKKKQVFEKAFPELDEHEIQHVQRRDNQAYIQEEFEKILKKENITPEEIPEKIRKGMFRGSGLWKLFHHYPSLYELISVAYPEKWSQEEFNQRHDEAKKRKPKFVGS